MSFEGKQSETTLDNSVGEWLGKAACQVAEQVHSYRQLVQELEMHGASREMVQRARSALQDEVRHARVLGNLAQQWLGRPPPVLVRAVEVRPLVEIALENAEKGCARATLEASIGLVQAGRAQDYRVARAMRSLAHDRLRHAQFSWDLHDWSLGQLSFKDSARVERALELTLEEIVSEGQFDDLPESSRVLLGLPDETELSDLARRTAETLQSARHVA